MDLMTTIGILVLVVWELLKLLKGSSGSREKIPSPKNCAAHALLEYKVEQVALDVRFLREAEEQRQSRTHVSR